MTLEDLQTRLMQRLDDAGGAGFYSVADLTNALNWAQRLFVLISLCLEKQAPFIAVTQYTHLRTVFPDWFLPLELRYSNTVRVVGSVTTYGYLSAPMVDTRIRPATLQMLNARNSSWANSVGNPKRYALLGSDFLVLDAGSYSGGPELVFRYVYSPNTMGIDTDTPQIPDADQPSLADGAIALLRIREGGQELQKAISGPFQSFLEVARSRGNQVRAKNREQQYDSVPPEISLADMSRLARGTK